MNLRIESSIGPDGFDTTIGHGVSGLLYRVPFPTIVFPFVRITNFRAGYDQYRFGIETSVLHEQSDGFGQYLSSQVRPTDVSSCIISIFITTVRLPSEDETSNDVGAV